MDKWEYKQIGGYQHTHKLNELGREGWELITHAVAFTSGAFGGDRTHHYTFKRKIVE